MSLGPLDPALGMPARVELETDGPVVESAGFVGGFTAGRLSGAFEGARPAEGLSLAGRICARSCLSHSYAFCAALEDAAALPVEESASALRLTLLEMERVASHLGVVARVGRALEDDVLFQGPRKYVRLIRKTLLRASGSPFGFGMIIPGGVNVECETAPLREFSAVRKPLERDCSFWKARMRMSASRLASCVLSRREGEPFPTSPVFRASGSTSDMRGGDGSYCIYGDLGFEPATRDGGSSRDRLMVLLEEVACSLALVEKAAGPALEAGGVGPAEFERFDMERRSGTGFCESPEGSLEHHLYIGSENRMIRDRVRCAAGAVAGAAMESVPGTPLEDIVPCLMSFGLCTSCIDL